MNGLSAATVSLTAPVVSIPGALIGTTSVALAATGGGISGSGAVTTPLLTGGAAGTVDLTGTNASLRWAPVRRRRSMRWIRALRWWMAGLPRWR